LKTYKGWKESNFTRIYDYLNIGDEVDEEMIDYFRDIMPPIIMNFCMLQVGELADHIGGKATYMTFVKEKGRWIYKGDCVRGGF